MGVEVIDLHNGGIIDGLLAIPTTKYDNAIIVGVMVGRVSILMEILSSA